VVGELDLPLAEPGDGKGVTFECGFPQDWVVAAAIEGDGEAVGVNRHGASRRFSMNVHMMPKLFSF